MLAWVFKFFSVTTGPNETKLHVCVCGGRGGSSIGSVIASMMSQNCGQDGRHGSKMATMAPIPDDVQAQIRFMTSDDPVTRSVSPRKVS